MEPDVAGIYRKLEMGGKPSNDITRDECGRIKSVVSNSSRNDVVCLKHLEDNKYAGIRIESKEESQNDMIQRNMKNPPHKFDANKKFECCIYQLGIFNISEFREEDININQTMIHRACSWNSNHVTKLRRATSARQLENAWLEHIKI